MKRFITSFLLMGVLFNAANSQPNPTKTIYVIVKNSATDKPVNETEVTYKDFNGTQRQITNSGGRVTFQVKLLTNPMEASIVLNDGILEILGGYNRKATKVNIELKEEQDVYEVEAIFHSNNKGIMVSVTDAGDNGNPLGGAKVTLSNVKAGKDDSNNTDGWGNVSFEVSMTSESKTVPVIVEKPGYETFKTTVQLNNQKNKNLLSVVLERDKYIKILRVKVISTPDLLPVNGANVIANGKGFHGFATGSTDEAGVATLVLETGGEFLVTVTHGNFDEEQKTVTIKKFGEDKETILPFEVKRKSNLKRDLKVYVYEANSGNQPLSKIGVFVNGRPGFTGSDGIAEFTKILFMGEIGKIEIPPSDIYEGASQIFLGGGDQTRYLPSEKDATLLYITKKPETILGVTVRVLDEKTMSPVSGVVTQIKLADGILTPYDTTNASGEKNIKINKKYLVNAPLRLFVERKKGYEDKWVDLTDAFLQPPQDGKIFTVFIKKINKEKGRDLKVRVRDSKTLKPVAKATVNVNGINVITDGSGLAVFSTISTAGEEKTIYVTANGYEQTEKDYKAGSEAGTAGSVPADAVEVILTKKPGRASFIVQVLDNTTNKPIPGASAVIKLYNGTEVSEKEQTNLKGEAELEINEGAPTNGQFRLVASATNYEEKWNDIPNSYLTDGGEKKHLQIFLKIKQAYPGKEVTYGPFPANLKGWTSTGLKFKRGGTFRVEVDKVSKLTVPDENDKNKTVELSPAGNGHWGWWALKAKIGIDMQDIVNAGGYVDKDGILELGVPRLWTFYPQDAVGSSGNWMVYVTTSDAEQISGDIPTTETGPVKNDNPTNTTQPSNEKTEKAKKDLEFLKKIAKGELPNNGSIETVMLGITYVMSEYKLFFSPLSASNDCISTIKVYLSYPWTRVDTPSAKDKYEFNGCINPLIADLEYKINNNLIK